jgi:hypothetical protein
LSFHRGATPLPPVLLLLLLHSASLASPTPQPP